MPTWSSNSAEETRQLGRQLGQLLRAGDLILLHGGLGAGKTTFTQGIAAGLGVEGRVVSPTFIVSRTHASTSAGPALVHVDAYRIEDDLDLETLDLDTSLPQAVTVVEWGAGKAEALSDQRLEVSLEVTGATGDWTTAQDEGRQIHLTPVGEDWVRRLVEAGITEETG